VEALIGAYFISGGQGGALHFMETVGFRGPTSVKNERVPFGKWPYPAPKYNPGSDSVSNHHSLFHELENVICYKFKEPWLLVEAFSHPCYMKNRVTECYQRLEFLGDAVLDFLITNHIYKRSRVMDPGDLTDLRSALVNNVTFGSLSVRYGFETYLLNTDRKLQEAIDVFVECQKAVKHQVTGHFKLLDDSECHLVSDIDCPKVLGDIFESLAGAVFIDCGMSLDTVWKVFYRLMKNEIDMFSLNVPKSPVRALYENNPGRAIFKDVTEEAFKTGAEKDPGMCYVVLTVPISDQRGKLRPVIGRGKSKQSAKLAAAKYANKLLEFHKAARK
jgi:endoribonuclease Dicer